MGFLKYDQETLIRTFNFRSTFFGTKFTDPQGLKCQIPRFSQRLKFSISRILTFSISQVLKHADFQILRFPDSQIVKFSHC